MSRFQKSKTVTIKKPVPKAEQALRMAKSNKKKLAAKLDLDFVNDNDATQALNATPTVLLIFASMEMSGFNLTLKSFQVRGVIKQNLASAIIDDYRVDLVLDRAPAGVAITPLLYLDSATPTITAFKSFGSKGRYRILKTWSGYLSSSEGSHSFRKVNSYIRLNFKVETKAENAYTQANLIKNALYLVRWTTATANQPTVAMDMRIVYDDERT